MSKLMFFFENPPHMVLMEILLTFENGLKTI